jgi:predicted signal transduction protein with EAL and GGDEF domain
LRLKSQEIVVSVSIGVLSSSTSCTDSEQLLRDAEIAMYKAKRTGKARCELFDPAMHATAVRRLNLETDLRRALERGELVVYYQPIISLTTGKIIGFEALSRWQRSDAVVAPGEFIPLADETGLILPINRALLYESCRQLRFWQTQLGCNPPHTMSVNIAPKQFAQQELANEIATILKDVDVDPGTINLEITETIAMCDPDRALAVLSDLKALGARISLDDFGTGYSSLSRLPRFPIDAVKIDRIFISNMNDHRSRES